jgi:hypothetical protein
MLFHDILCRENPPVPLRISMAKKKEDTILHPEPGPLGEPH